MRYFIRFAICAAALAATASGTALAATIGLTCNPAGADLDNPMPMEITSQQRKGLIKSYAAPEVRGLRSALDAYLAGTPSGNTARYLAGVSHATLQQKFVLLADESNPMGGSYLTVQFRRHPEAIYRGWVYKSSNGAYEIRSWDRAACSAAQQRYMQIEYGDVWSSVPGG